MLKTRRTSPLRRSSLTGTLLLALLALVLACKTQAPASARQPPSENPKGSNSAPSQKEPDQEPEEQETGLQAGDLKFSTPTTLGQFPLCEASGAVIAPWDPEQVLIADNEQRALFAFALENGALREQREIPLPGGAPRDIEALAQLDGRILVVGSFSRNSACEQKANRARFMWVEGDGEGGLRELSLIRNPGALHALEDVTECLETLFESPAPPLAREVCEALGEAERLARTSEGEQCETLNIEAAVGLPAALSSKLSDSAKAGDGAGESAAGRIWLGLRSPLVHGNAVLLRMSPGHDAFRFDQVVLLDLDGNGLRGLEVYEDTVLGISGPPSDSKEDFKLFSFPLSALQQAAPKGNPPSETALQVRSLSSLPSSSEGIVVAGDHLVVVVDGKFLKGEECKKPALQVLSKLP